LTVRRYAVNGLLFTKAYDDNVSDPTKHEVLRGYRASYITSANSGLYGIYAFFASDGIIENSYASGHPDSGIYIGQCKPCNAIVRNTVAELNAVGYEGTNASGNLYVVNSTWRRNRIGITPNSQDMERLAPQGDIVVAGNLVEDNQDPAAPSAAQGGSGFGIAVGGGIGNLVTKNLVRRNVTAGIVVTDLAGYVSKTNRVTSNALVDNGTDLAFYASDGAGRVDGAGNCFSANTFTDAQPTDIEKQMACEGATGRDANDPYVVTGPLTLQPGAPNVDYTKVPLPPDQTVMPDASSSTRKIVPAVLDVKIDIEAIQVPKP
jgi:Right handed beta helix region